MLEKQRYEEERLEEDPDLNDGKSSTDDSSTSSHSEESKSSIDDEKPLAGGETSEINISTPSTFPYNSPKLSKKNIVLDKKDQKKLEKFMDHMKDFQEQLSIINPDVTSRFKDLATEVVIPNIISHFKGKPFEAVAAAILNQACRDVEYPITIRQIVTVSNAKEKIVNKCIMTIKELLPSEGETKHFNAGEMIEVITSKLMCSESTKKAAHQVWKNIEKLNFIKSIHSATLAACCILISSLLSKDQVSGANTKSADLEAVANAAGITKLTLRTSYRMLHPYRSYFITEDCKLQDPTNLKEF